MFKSIRTRLVVSIVGIVLFTAITVSLSSLVPMYFYSQEQVIERLQSVAALRALEITTWLESIEGELNAVQSEEYADERIRIVLTMSQFDTYYDFFIGAVRNRFQINTNLSDQLDRIAIFDAQNQRIIDTQSPSALSAQQTMCIEQLVRFCPLVADTITSIQFVMTIDAGSQSGYIVALVNPDPLLTILNSQNNLGATGKSYLLFDNRNMPNVPVMLTTHSDAYPFSFIGSQQTGADLYTDMSGTPVIGAYVWIPEIGATLFVEQNQNEAFASLLTTLPVNLVAITLAVLLALVIAFFTARIFANSLSDLAQTTMQVAQGDFSENQRFTHTKREDEIGDLARSFETMTHRLRDLFNTLETRVADRTNDLQVMNRGLQRRALQLETSAQLSREISSILNIDELLERVVWLIKESFAYYHVHIFLLDDTRQLLDLTASTTQHNLQIQVTDGGLNSAAIEDNKAVLSSDVRQDPQYLEDEMLPETRSELVVPLRIGQQMIGTLDVMSQHIDGFSSEDVTVLQSLGDQIAIAIENARLYASTHRLAVLEERTRLARNLHDSVTQSVYSLNLLSEGWRRIVVAGEVNKAPEFLARVNEITGQILLEMRLLIYELQPLDLGKQSLSDALQQRIQTVENRMGIDAQLAIDVSLELPDAVNSAFYWIVREALNNVLKHAQASHVYIRIYHDDATHGILEVEDDGRGFETETLNLRMGMGLSNMQQRMTSLGGQLTIDSVIGQGTTIRATIEHQRDGQ